jgi:formylglycine-generating enzyme required for sulfatase activity
VTPSDQEKSIGEEESLVGRRDPGQHDTQARSLGEDDTRIPLSSIAEQQNIPSDVVDLADRYRIELPLGQGGMGHVVLATDSRLDRKVAIKRILDQSVTIPAAVQRFLTEAKAIAALSHPNIVQIHDFGWAKDGPFLIMEYVDGGNLLERCHQAAFPVDEAIKIACQLCDGLGRAHEAGIVHRDIKPANVLLTRDGIPKLTDFGLAKAETADTGMTMAGAVLGTLDFMPPEQRRDAALTDARSDLWSLAATLYQMVTGRSPKIIKFNDVPKALQDVLGKALEDEKDKRYQSARELKEALKQSLQRKAFKPVESTNADLGAGECPSCRSLNESHRKFCRECGEPLRCKCLQCQHEIPVWDKVCPECGAKQAELAAKLLESIKNRLQNHELEGLLPLVEKAVSLPGDREDLKKLAAQLKEWEQKQTRERDEAFQRAENLLSEGNAREALKAVKPIYPKRLTPTQNTLLEKLERIGAADNELRQMIQRAKSDGVIDAEVIVALLPKTIEYIRLNPNNQGFLKLKDDLLARIGNVPVELLRNLPEEYIEELPVNTISKLPEHVIIKLPTAVVLKMPSFRNSIGMAFKLLPPGIFMMGDARGKPDEKLHQVTLTKPFYMGVYEVTQEQYGRVMGVNPKWFMGTRNSVELVSWEKSLEFCWKLSTLPAERASGRVYRLPTEAEWEYACRAGSTTRYCFGDDESPLCQYAWYDKNSGSKTHPVGEKNPNAWGLYDMHGNVWEWCSDWYGDYPEGAVSDPTGPSKGSGRVRRGGGWISPAMDCRSAIRSSSIPSYSSGIIPSIGFRVALSFRSGIP